MYFVNYIMSSFSKIIACFVSNHFLFPVGPGFAIYAVVHLLLPVMSMWLSRSQGDHSYWDAASGNFKHAIGLSCELVVEHIQSFINSGNMFFLYSCFEKQENSMGIFHHIFNRPTFSFEQCP